MRHFLEQFFWTGQNVTKDIIFLTKKILPTKSYVTPIYLNRLFSTLIFFPINIFDPVFFLTIFLPQNLNNTNIDLTLISLIQRSILNILIFLTKIFVKPRIYSTNRYSTMIQIIRFLQNSNKVNYHHTQHISGGK